MLHRQPALAVQPPRHALQRRPVMRRRQHLHQGGSDTARVPEGGEHRASWRFGSSRPPQHLAARWNACLPACLPAHAASLPRHATLEQSGSQAVRQAGSSPTPPTHPTVLPLTLNTKPHSLHTDARTWADSSAYCRSGTCEGDSRRGAGQEGWCGRRAGTAAAASA